MSNVFARGARLPVAASGHGSRIWDADGKRYLDGSGGALVVNVGHGRAEVVDAISAQLGRVGYVHASKFTTEVLEEYAAKLAALAPLDDARVYPVSGGSEAVETALKMARAYHSARGFDRRVVVAREGSYHGNSRGALAVSGRRSLRAPYEPWLHHTVHVPAPYEYRCPFPQAHPDGCADAHARRLAEVIEEAGADNVAAFVAEPVSGAALGACVPPRDYWAAVSRVCRRHGILLIADEVLTGFGRTGRWFASDHWGLRPDIVVAGKGAGSGYWPLGLAICDRRVHEVLAETGFTHGFTYSHHAAGAAAGLAVLNVLDEEGLVASAAAKGPFLEQQLRRRLGSHRHVGDVRGIGLFWAVELVRDRETREPFARGDGVVEQITQAAADSGMLVYFSTGCADGVNGDAVVLGPPLTTSEAELVEMATLTDGAVVDVLG